MLSKQHHQHPHRYSRKFLLAAFTLLSSSCIHVSAFGVGVPFLLGAARTASCCRYRDSVRFPLHHQAKSSSNSNSNDTGEEQEAEDEEEDADYDERNYVVLPQGIEDSLTVQDLEGMTVEQLKQQLRLRGLKVGGRKSELMARLLSGNNNDAKPKIPTTTTTTTTTTSETTTTPAASGAAAATATTTPNASRRRPLTMAQILTQEQGKELVDVTEYLDEEDKGKSVKTWKGSTVVDADFDKENNDNPDDSSNPGNSDNKAETWGSEARIVDDYEGRNVVVDGLSRTVVEFKGSNQSYVSAFVVASRDALKPFLAGGRQQGANVTAAEDRLREIQTKREKSHRTRSTFQGPEGVDEGDPTGIYDNVLDRDFSDWGAYTVSGALMSAAEVQGVLLLSDIYGAFNEDTQALAERIAFECQPVVVMVPDLFRGQPWKEKPTTPGKNAKGETYEEWRATHPDLRVSIDIRAAAACLRERYGVSSVVLWGTCFGGGRALEAAAGYRPGDKIHDVDGSVGPPLVAPGAVIAWYPTRYDASVLFGKHRTVGKLETTVNDAKARQDFAVMAVFAGNDILPGATPDDASKLKALLEEDERVKDSLVKVFSGQEHGFGHIGLASKSGMDEDSAFGRFVDDEFGGAGKVSLNDGEADVACLLSTAFMETYSRVFLPTIGPSIRDDEDEWSVKLEMKDLNVAKRRDVRQEIERAANSFIPEPLGGRRIDPMDGDDQEALAEYLRESARVNGIDVSDDDDVETLYEKNMAFEGFELF